MAKFHITYETKKKKRNVEGIQIDAETAALALKKAKKQRDFVKAIEIFRLDKMARLSHFLFFIKSSILFLKQKLKKMEE